MTEHDRERDDRKRLAALTRRMGRIEALHVAIVREVRARALSFDGHGAEPVIDATRPLVRAPERDDPARDLTAFRGYFVNADSEPGTPDSTFVYRATQEHIAANVSEATRQPDR